MSQFDLLLRLALRVSAAALIAALAALLAKVLRDTQTGVFAGVTSLLLGLGFVYLYTAIEAYESRRYVARTDRAEAGRR